MKDEAILGSIQGLAAERWQCVCSWRQPPRTAGPLMGARFLEAACIRLLQSASLLVPCEECVSRTFLGYQDPQLRRMEIYRQRPGAKIEYDFGPAGEDGRNGWDRRRMVRRPTDRPCWGSAPPELSAHEELVALRCSIPPLEEGLAYTQAGPSCAF